MRSKIEEGKRRPDNRRPKKKKGGLETMNRCLFVSRAV
jgi:hypothetical protein